MGCQAALPPQQASQAHPGISSCQQRAADVSSCCGQYGCCVYAATQVIHCSCVLIGQLDLGIIPRLCGATRVQGFGAGGQQAAKQYSSSDRMQQASGLRLHPLPRMMQWR